MTRVVVFLEDGTELSIDGSDLAVDVLAARIKDAFAAPGSALSLYARNNTHVVPVRAIRYVRVEPDTIPTRPDPSVTETTP